LEVPFAKKKRKTARVKTAARATATQGSEVKGCTKKLRWGGLDIGAAQASVSQRGFRMGVLRSD